MSKQRDSSLPEDSEGERQIRSYVAQSGNFVVVDVAVFREGDSSDSMSGKNSLVAKKRSDVQPVCELVSGSNCRAVPIDLREVTIAAIRVIFRSKETLPERCFAIWKRVRSTRHNSCEVEIEGEVSSDSISRIKG